MISAAITDTGIVREENQDSIYVSDSSIGLLPNLYIIADGMGGHRAGEVASSKAIEAFVENVENTGLKDILSILQESVAAANAILLEMSEETKAYRGMGTTLVVAVVDETSLYVANVGDSRLYILSDEIKQITRDHSLVQEMINIGELDINSAEVYKNKNVITKAVGTESNLTADFFDIEITQEDIILMCSDGLTNMIDDSEIHEIVKTEGVSSDTALSLIQKANQNGGRDNISVILIKKDVSE